MKSTRAALAALAALAVLLLSPLALRAQEAPSFDSLQAAGLREVRAVPAAAAAPAGAPIPAAPSDARGVFLHSQSGAGALYFCSASGCRLLADGAALTLLAKPGSLYYTGPKGTGWCSAAGCKTLLPGRVTFPLTASDDGDVYASDIKTGWHCTPDACKPASAGPIQIYNNYVAGVYRPGAFVMSSAEGTFWCAGGKCARVSDREMVLFDGTCEGPTPAKLAYGFSGPEIYRCAPTGCRKIADEESASVDNYVECAFDKSGRVHLPRRTPETLHAPGSVICGDSCAVASHDDLKLSRISRAGPARSSEFFLTGDDGALYRLASHAADAEPGPGAPRLQHAGITREEGGRADALSFDAPAVCWEFISADEDDEVGPMWDNRCRLER